MTNICLRLWNWCKRFRNRCGYGVHSPSDFFLITFVIYERLPYYAYARLHKMRKEMECLPHYREKVDKLLFRLANYLRPSLLLEIGTGSGLSSCYMMEGDRQMEVVTVTDSYEKSARNLLSDYPKALYGAYDIEQIKNRWIQAATSKVIVHIAHTNRYKEIFESLVPLVGANTCFIISSPYADNIKKEWWKKVIMDPRTGVTFDLYDIGLVFFDKKRVKEHRVVNFF